MKTIKQYQHELILIKSSCDIFYKYMNQEDKTKKEKTMYKK